MSVVSYTFVIDKNQKRLLDAVGSLNSADTPKFYRGDTAEFTVRLVAPSGSFSDPTPTVQIPAGASLVAAIGVPGASLDVVVAVPAALVARDTVSARLALTTANFRDLLGNASSRSASLEFRLVEQDGSKTILAQVECTLFNVVTFDSSTPTEASTTAGVAIQLCEAAASSATSAASAANTAKANADTATANATSAASAANTAASSATSAASAANTAANAANYAAQNIQYGKSAYDLAVYNGFVGTEQEWLLSLRGQMVGSGGVVSLTASRALTEDDNGKVLVNFGATPYTLTFNPNTLSTGFGCVVVPTSVLGLVTVVAGGGATHLNSYGYTKTRAAGSPMSLLALSQTLIVSLGDMSA